MPKNLYFPDPMSKKVNETRQEAFQDKSKFFLNIDKESAVETLDLLKS